MANPALELGRLVCGTPQPDCTLTEILAHLRSTLSSISIEIESLKTDPGGAARFALFGPFLGRSLLEVAFTAILGRLDPFRVVILREIQLRPDYAPEKRSQASIQWSGDIHAERKVDDLWRADRSVKDMTRALFGDYYEQIFWRGAFQRLVDSVPEDRGGEWMRELRRIPPEGILPSLRIESARIYSACSKGVHHEFLIPATHYYDAATLTVQLKSATELVARVALVANASKDMLFRLPIDEAIECFERLQVYNATT